MDPDQRISELPLLTPEEKRQILEGWNRTSHDYPRDETVPGRFEEQVARSPSSVALVYGRTSLTYGDLNARANGLALQLTKAGFMPGSAAVILMDRRPELPITHLAILKAGGICVPMNPTDPKDRIALVLKDTSAPLLLTSKDHSEQLPQGSAKIIFVEDSLLGSNPNEANFSNRPTVPSTAYIIYTSGSMGTPKGVCIPHRAILRTAINNSFVEFLPADTVASVTNPAFDVSLGELWGALLNGARIAIFDREITLSPSAFVARVRETGVKVMFTTPTLLNLMVREVPTAFLGIRDLITGGEVLDPSLAKEILAGSKPGRLINVYGPTEGTVLSTWHVVKDVAEDSPIPIGRPIANTQAYILDKNLQPVPVGVRGELYLGGDGLSSGYYNRPELTAAAFLPNPFSGDPSSKIFRTGDICRYLHDGNIEFVGRSDLQVKIRGFRIELGEIEAMLGRHPAVKTAVAVVWGEGQADRRLVAYVSPIPNATIDPSQLKDYLKGLLPDYMIPSAIMVLPELPLMPNGKVDRRALPPPEPPRTGRSEADAMAHSHEELELIEMWEDLLRVKPIGVNDNFFDLGGHSMMAVRLFARIEEKFKVRMPLATLFQSPTIKELAKVLRAKEPSQLGDLLVPLQGSGSGSPLFLLHAADGDVLNYTAFVRSYGPGRPIYGIQSRGINGEAQPLTSIEEMGTQYVHAVQKIRPHGPYLLLGYSEGALPAYEMARQFAEAGEEVGLLAIIDASTPGQKESEAATRRREFVVEFLNLYVDIRQAIPKGNLRDLIRTFPQRIANLILYGLQAVGFQRKSAEPLLPGWAFYLSEARKRTIIANIKAAKAYRPKKYQGVVTLYRQTPFPMLSTLDPQMGWQRLAREVDSTTISGYIHGNMLKPPQVAKLVLDLKKRVDAVDGPQNV
jgi:amino acid adenylation domain-containing protein